MGPKTRTGWIYILVNLKTPINVSAFELWFPRRCQIITAPSNHRPFVGQPFLDYKVNSLYIYRMIFGITRSKEQTMQLSAELFIIPDNNMLSNYLLSIFIYISTIVFETNYKDGFTYFNCLLVISKQFHENLIKTAEIINF